MQIADPSFLPPNEAVDDLLAGLRRPARLLVAVSGGSDSWGLLCILRDRIGCASVDGVSLFAATVDHGLRAESAQEAAMVAALGGSLGVPHLIRRWEGDKPRTGVPAAARQARYRLLVEMADEVDATAILTGHTFEDQCETASMRAARKDGDGNLGLSGMAEAVLLERRRWLLRPFLSTRRAEIRNALTGMGGSWIDDPSNIDPRYERVRVRQVHAARGHDEHQRIVEAAAKRSELSARAAEFLGHSLSLERAVLAHLPVTALEAEPLVQRHAFGVLTAFLGGRVHLPGTETMDRIMAFLGEGKLGCLTAGRVIFDRRRDRIYLHREKRDLPLIPLAAGEEALWDDRYRIVNESDDAIVVSPTSADPDQARHLFPNVPTSIAVRAMAAMPQVSARATGAGRAMRVEPIVAPFDRFLSLFDIDLAARLAQILGREPYPSLPIKLWKRKS